MNIIDHTLKPINHLDISIVRQRVAKSDRARNQLNHTAELINGKLSKNILNVKELNDNRDGINDDMLFKPS